MTGGGTEGGARNAIDHDALADALRALGLLYGARHSLADTVAGAASEADAVRAYLQRERPHLLRCYDIDALVALVLDARAVRPDSQPGIERFDPA